MTVRNSLFQKLQAGRVLSDTQPPMVLEVRRQGLEVRGGGVRRCEGAESGGARAGSGGWTDAVKRAFRFPVTHREFSQAVGTKQLITWSVTTAETCRGLGPPPPPDR